MSKKLTVGNEVFEYPVQGSANYGEEATAWAEAVSEVIATVIGPGDILTQQVSLNGASGNINGLVFDISFVQRILVEGIITRENLLDSTKKVESFVIDGVYNGSEFNFSITRTGEDTDIDINITGPASGQFVFTNSDVDPNKPVTMKFKAKSIIDEELLGL